MATAENISVLKADEDRFCASFTVRFDFDEVGYVAYCYDAAVKGYNRRHAVLYLENKPFGWLPFYEEWEDTGISVKKGEVSKALYTAMSAAFDVAYKFLGYKKGA